MDTVPVPDTAESVMSFAMGNISNQDCLAPVRNSFEMSLTPFLSRVKASVSRITDCPVGIVPVKPTTERLEGYVSFVSLGLVKLDVEVNVIVMYVIGAVPTAPDDIGTAIFEPENAAVAEKLLGENHRGSGNWTSTLNSVVFRSRWSDTVTALTTSA